MAQNVNYKSLPWGKLKKKKEARKGPLEMHTINRKFMRLFCSGQL